MSQLLVKFATLQLASKRTAPPICRLFASTNSSANKIIDKTQNKASPEQLALLEAKLEKLLPGFFRTPHQLDMYTKDVIFIDNIRGVRIEGILMYAVHIALIKAYHHMRYSSANVKLLNLVKNPEESYIRVRWRILSTPGLLRSYLNVGKFKLREGEEWKDGISTLQVNERGLIYCHVCDNIDIETDDTNGANKEKQSVKNPLYC